MTAGTEKNCALRSEQTHGGTRERKRFAEAITRSANLPGPYNNKVKRDEIEREARENEGSGKRGIMEKE